MQRRRFLQMVVAGTGVALVPACGDDGAKPASGPIAAGNVKDVAVGALVAVGGQPVVLGRDSRGLYAMSTICTHQQCDIRSSGSISASGLNCNCHGSQFDATGGVKRGPAASPLDHYRVDVAAGGDITIQAGTIVAADARFNPPG